MIKSFFFIRSNSENKKLPSKRLRPILLFVLLLATGHSHAEPIPPHEGEILVADQLSYYRTTANYLTAGTSSTDLTLGGYYSLIVDSLVANYDINPNIRIWAGSGYGYAVASNNTTTDTGSNLTEFDAGAQYWFKGRNWALVPSASFGYPFYRVNAQTITNSLVSNASAWFEGGSWAIYYFHPWAISGYLGYRYQDGGQAGLMNGDAGGSFRFSTARARVGIRGETTVTNDTNTAQPGVRNLVTTNVDNTSLHFYSVNPTNVEAYAELEWIFTRAFEVGGGVAESFYGNNSAQGWTVSGLVRWRIPSEGNRSNARARDSQFEGTVDKWDEKSFEDSKPDDVNPTPRRHKKPETLDSIMNDTEKKLDH